MNAKLRELVLAVRYGDASLVGESVGYIILGAADRAVSVPRRADLDSLLLTGEGEIAIDAATCAEEESERSLRSLLKSLLQLVRSPCPNLERVALRPQPAGLNHLVVELEAALVPVNRRAARRSISRLVREARRSAARADRGALVAPVPVEQWQRGVPPMKDPPAEETSPWAPIVGESGIACVESTRGKVIEVLPSVAEDPAVLAEVSLPDAVAFEPSAALGQPEEEGERPWNDAPSEFASLEAEKRVHAEEASLHTVADGAWGATSVFRIDVEDELDQAQTVVRAPVAEVAPPRPRRPVALFLHSGRGELPDDLPLIAPAKGEAPFRPSDTAELLSSEGSLRAPSSALYQGLKQLSQLDSHLAGATGGRLPWGEEQS